MPSDPIHLYGFFPGDRSGRVRWMLNELELRYEDHWLDFRAGDQHTPEYRAISPLGRVPALRCGSVALCETGPILNWLGANFGQGSLNPAAHDPWQYASWLAIASSTLDPVCFEFVRPDVPEEDRTTRRSQAFMDLRRSLFGPLNDTLASRDTILPSGFCAIDIQVAASLHYADTDGRLAEQPRLAEWLANQRLRPAGAAAGLFG